MTGIIIVVVGKGKLFVMLKKLTAHIPLHHCTHNVTLTVYIIFAQRLNDIHYEQPRSKDGKHFDDNRLFLNENRIGSLTEKLRINKVNKAYDRRTKKVEEKYFSVRLIITDKFFKQFHFPLLPSKRIFIFFEKILYSSYNV